LSQKNVFQTLKKYISHYRCIRGLGILAAKRKLLLSIIFLNDIKVRLGLLMLFICHQTSKGNYNMEIHHACIDKLQVIEITDILKNGCFGHLGCQNNKEVYVVPITYAFLENTIYSHSKKGKKIEMMRANPNICIQVEKVTDVFHWKSIIAWGRFEELEGEKANQAMRVLVKQLSEIQKIKNTSSLEIDFEAMFESSIIFQIKIEKFTGRQEYL
jgi:nitroimidazol reductase NimA-like FMN-containing flavoprotein (pyridoxamine 5'-phosphate oxidase superfamily)